MSEAILEKREAIRNEKITMTKATYQTNAGRFYNKGRVHALLMVGYTIPEIAVTLGLNEGSVRKLADNK